MGRRAALNGRDRLSASQTVAVDRAGFRSCLAAVARAGTGSLRTAAAEWLVLARVVDASVGWEDADLIRVTAPSSGRRAALERVARLGLESPGCSAVVTGGGNDYVARVGAAVVRAHRRAPARMTGAALDRGRFQARQAKAPVPTTATRIGARAARGAAHVTSICAAVGASGSSGASGSPALPATPAFPVVPLSPALPPVADAPESPPDPPDADAPPLPAPASPPLAPTPLVPAVGSGGLVRSSSVSPQAALSASAAMHQSVTRPSDAPMRRV